MGGDNCIPNPQQELNPDKKSMLPTIITNKT